MAVTKDEFESANRRGKEQRAKGLIVAARYDRERNRIILSLSLGYDIVIPPQAIQDTEFAKPEELEVMEITPPGLAVHFPRIDGDIYLPGLLKGITGTKKWMKARGLKVPENISASV